MNVLKSILPVTFLMNKSINQKPMTNTVVYFCTEHGS